MPDPRLKNSPEDLRVLDVAWRASREIILATGERFAQLEILPPITKADLTDEQREALNAAELRGIGFREAVSVAKALYDGEVRELVRRLRGMRSRRGLDNTSAARLG